MMIIDRFEGEFAVIETSNGFINVPYPDLPAAAKEGDVLIITLDKANTEARKQRIESMMSKLFND